jgi:hypothetical protein
MPKAIASSKDEVKAMLILACERIIARGADAVPGRP